MVSERKDKVAIGIPHLGPIRPYFFDTFVNLRRPADAYVIRIEDKPVDTARNMIVETALADPETTHVFFMDSDMGFPTYALGRLGRDRKPIVGGVYFQRGGVPSPHIYRFHHEDNPDGSCPVGRDHSGQEAGCWYVPLVDEFAAWVKRHPEQAEHPAAAVLPATADALIECDAIATGCLLIAREVFEAIAAAHPGERWPWFRSHATTGGGEDFYFCREARAAGFSVWADLGVQCTHEFRYAFLDRADFIDHFAIGSDHETDFSELMVDVAPQHPEPPRNPLAGVLASEAS